MSEKFAENFAALRHINGLSQRKAAEELKISQALLSHYENGLREPRLDFVVKACGYYGVSADFMLGMSGDKATAAGEFLSFAGQTLDMVKSRYGENACVLLEKYMKTAFYKLIACADKEEGALCDIIMAEAGAKIAGELAFCGNTEEKFAEEFPTRYEEIKKALKELKAR